MIVILNNGTRIKIDNEMAQAVFRRILSEEGAKNWQIQLNAEKQGVMGFDLKQISAICAEDDIVERPDGFLE